MKEAPACDRCNLQKKEAPLFKEALLFKGVGVIVTGRLTHPLGFEQVEAVGLLLECSGLLLAGVLERAHGHAELHPHLDGCSLAGWLWLWHLHATAVAQLELWRLHPRGDRDPHVGQRSCRTTWPLWRKAWHREGRWVRCDRNTANAVAAAISVTATGCRHVSWCDWLRPGCQPCLALAAHALAVLCPPP